MLPENFDELSKAFQNRLRLTCKEIPMLTEILVGLANSGGGIVTVECEHPYTIDRQGIEPSIEFIIEQNFIIVPDAPQKPYLYKGRIPLIKAGKIAYPSRNELIELIKSQQIDYTDQTVGRIEGNFFQSDELKSLRDRLEKIYGAGISSIFETAGLLKNGEATRAFVLLCGKDPELYIPGASILLQVQGREPQKVTGPLRSLQQSLFHLISGKITEVMENYELINSQFRDCLKDLIGEIIVNALIHRDYSVPLPITVSYMDMEVRVWNPGVPAGEREVPTPSSIYIRNPKLYKFAGIIGLAKTSGSGLLRLSKRALLCNNVQLTYEKANGGTLATLSFKSTVQSRRLNEREKKLLEYIKNTGYITRKDYEKLMGVSERTARLDLSNLVKRGILKKIGKGKNTIYEPV